MTREERNAYNRAWYAKHREQHMAACRRWQKANVPKTTGYSRRWRAKNPGKEAVYSRNKYLRFREWVDELKSSMGCKVCGEVFPSCLDFHHKDRENKLFCIGNGHGKSREAVEKEIEKCVLLCANCHRKLHWKPDEDDDPLAVCRGLAAHGSGNGNYHNHGVHVIKDDT